ncbi:hypothetical protein [uncultured Marinobacter sp.]|uniref:hypothetical protein n=1 Tax=uncultured Marinobacter sp. TaxID=187379 RepID=UPI0030DC053E
MIPSILRPAALIARRQYVATMFQVMGHALEAISRTDDKVRKEARELPLGFIFEMTVLPAGPSLRVKHLGDGELAYLAGDVAPETINLSIRFKHIAHAFLVLSFQEQTAVAFANDRMLVNGDISYAVRMTRILNRLESFILPKVIASRAVKEYPVDLPLFEKLTGALRIYRRVALSLVKELNPL